MRRSIALLTFGLPPLLGCGSSEPLTPTCAEVPGIACVYAGTGTAGFNGDGLPRRESRFYSPVDLAFAPDGTPWLIDFNNHRLRTVEADGTMKTRVGGMRPGDGDENEADLTPAGAHGTEVLLNHPTDLAFQPDGTVLFAAWHNFKIRSYTPATGQVHVLFGGKYYMGGYSGDGGPAADAAFNFPKALERAADGTLYIGDQRNFRIRKVSPEGDRTIVTLAGSGQAGFADGPALTAQFKWEGGNAPMPSGALALHPTQPLLVIADSLNHRIRALNLETNEVTTLVNATGTAGYSGDGAEALNARLSNPRDIEFAPDGTLYIADTDNHVVRAVGSDGLIRTVAGTGQPGTGAEGQAATTVALNKPWGIALDGAGALHIADTENHRFLKVPR